MSFLSTVRSFIEHPENDSLVRVILFTFIVGCMTSVWFIVSSHQDKLEKIRKAKLEKKSLTSATADSAASSSSSDLTRKVSNVASNIVPNAPITVSSIMAKTISNPNQILSDREHQILSEMKRLPVRILYATTTGTAKRYADLLNKELFRVNLAGFHFEVTVSDLSEYNFEFMTDDPYTIIILPTWTGGVPSKNAIPFCEFVHEQVTDFRVDRNHFRDYNFAIFGLGSIEYDHNHCRAAEELYERICSLQGKPILPLEKGDDSSDMELQFRQWMYQLIPSLCEHYARVHGVDEEEAAATEESLRAQSGCADTCGVNAKSGDNSEYKTNGALDGFSSLPRFKKSWEEIELDILSQLDRYSGSGCTSNDTKQGDSSCCGGSKGDDCCQGSTDPLKAAEKHKRKMENRIKWLAEGGDLEKKKEFLPQKEFRRQKRAEKEARELQQKEAARIRAREAKLQAQSQAQGENDGDVDVEQHTYTHLVSDEEEELEYTFEDRVNDLVMKESDVLIDEMVRLDRLIQAEENDDAEVDNDGSEPSAEPGSTDHKLLTADPKTLSEEDRKLRKQLRIAELKRRAAAKAMRASSILDLVDNRVVTNSAFQAISKSVQRSKGDVDESLTLEKLLESIGDDTLASLKSASDFKKVSKAVAGATKKKDSLKDLEDLADVVSNPPGADSNPLDLVASLRSRKESLMSSTLSTTTGGTRQAEMTEEEYNNSLPEMVTPAQRKALQKEGYRLVLSHSATKLCRWVRHQLRGRGGCYKHTFYGITSYQCMEATPSLACANKCTFCWRHLKQPSSRSFRWKVDDPLAIVEGCIKSHCEMIRAFKGTPGLVQERWLDALTPRHCALSLVGEPIMYPRINEFLRLLHARRISSFLVTNAQFPECMETLEPVTQLYVSIDAATKETLRAIDRPLFFDFWERFLRCLELLRLKRQRTVYRLTLVKGQNMSFEDIDNYLNLIELGKPDLIEVKGMTWCGTSPASDLTMQNVPWHTDVRAFCEELAKKYKERLHRNVASELLNGASRDESEDYELACEHAHSCCILLAKKQFKIDGKWHTHIDYDKFQSLIEEYYKTGKSFETIDYVAPTPDWAVYDAPEAGFSPADTRYRRNREGKKVVADYKPSDSGCG